jgi:hypothetical protein
MSEPTKSYELSELVERRQEAALELKWHGEVMLSIPHPDLWPDGVMTLGATGDSVGSLRLLVGNDAYDRFVETTGVGAQTVWAALTDHFGVSVGESKASSKK